MTSAIPSQSQHRGRLREGGAVPAGDARPPSRLGARLALAAVLVTAAALNLWALSRNGYDSYYAASARSGALSWKSFFYGSLDTGNFITIDKPPLTYWLEALTARVIGFGTWSLLLPQALAGVASTAVLHRTVRLVWGEAAALTAAALFALTPVTVAVARSNHPDMVLTLMLTLAAWAWVHALRSGRTAPLLWAGAALGLGFMAKMWAALVPLPVFALVYAVAAPVALRRRIAQLAAAGAVMTAVGGAWIAAVALTPAADRPYIGGTTGNSIMQSLWDTNGPGRLIGSATAADVLPPGTPPTVLGATPGIGRMFAPDVAGQVLWLLPLALAGLAAGLWCARRAPRTDPGRAAFVMWGAWALAHFVVFSFDKSQWHAYYTVAMAPALAALAGGGLVVMIRRELALPVLVGLVATVVWDVVLLHRTPQYAPWLVSVVAIVGGVGAVLTAIEIFVHRPGPLASGRHLAVAMAALAVAGTLGGPLAYDVTTIRTGAPQGLLQAGPLRRQVLPPIIWQSLPYILNDRQSTDPRMIAYLEQRRGRARWLLAASDGPTAGAFIMATGEPVMAMGGFRDTDPALTPSRLHTLVRRGDLRFVLLAPPLGGVRPPAAITVRDAWLHTNCRPAADGPSGGGQGQPVLLDCRPDDLHQPSVTPTGDQRK